MAFANASAVAAYFGASVSADTDLPIALGVMPSGKLSASEH